jgi:hypothetical protein
MLFICVTQIWEKDEPTENLKKRTQQLRMKMMDVARRLKKRPMPGKDIMDLSITMGHNVNEGPTCVIFARISKRYMWTG